MCEGREPLATQPKERRYNDTVSFMNIVAQLGPKIRLELLRGAEHCESDQTLLQWTQSLIATSGHRRATLQGAAPFRS